MKKFLKAFTLIELVIAMAIMTLLLAGILQLFAPVRAVYTETSVLDNKRNNCNTITKYMTESLRYSQYIGVYNAGASGTTTKDKAKDAADNLVASLTANMTDLGLTAADLAIIEDKIQVIVIDYTANDGSLDPDASTLYEGRTFSGRLFRYKTSNDSFHMSLGKAYYGTNDFGINVKFNALGNELSVVTSTQGFNNGGGEVTSGNEIVTTNGSAVLGNFDPSTGGKFFAEASDDSNSDGIADFLVGAGTLASGGTPQYFFAFIPAEDMPN